jgi:chemosensory pili system protein ChpA (sensor histidine kinase/response regulator)
MSSQVRAILAGELQQLAEEFQREAPALAERSEAAAAHCLDLCQRLAQVGDMIELPALEDVAMFLMSNIPGLIGRAVTAQPSGEVCAELRLCLLEGAESPRWEALAATLADARWPAALESGAAQEMVRGLRPLAIDEPERASAAPVPGISPDDLRLQPPEEVGAETLRAFFHEAPAQAMQLNQLLAGFGGGVLADDIAAAQRLAHTLKGSSALCGLHAVVHLAHAMETALQRLAINGELSTHVGDRLIEAGDTIEQLIELAAGGNSAPETLPGLIVRLCAEFEEGVPLPPEAAAPTLDPRKPAAASSGSAPRAPAVIAPTLNVPTVLIDDNLRYASEMNVAIDQLSAHIAGLLAHADRLAQQLTLVQSQVYELETLVDARATPVGQMRGAATRDFDPLELDEYTALHSLSRAFAESTLDSRELSREIGHEVLKLQNLLTHHARHSREMTDSVMQARMVPVATIVPRLQRIVRQTARMSDRQAELEIVGQDLSIDTDILAGLVEPLMHALRNAVDHGIETPAQRQALGKPEIGRIRVAFRRDGSRIEVSCADDGCGLDYAAIERRARRLGLLTPGEQPDASRLASLVFLHGFSTREEVSPVSGRGVGMDVVRSSIERLKGTTRIESRDGAGCTVTFRLPVSLTTAQVLFVATREGIYGLPSTTVDRVLYSDGGRVLPFGDRYAFEYDGKVAELHSLAALLGQSEHDPGDLQSRPLPVVIANGDAGPVALVVDRAVDSRQIVIKGLSPLLPALPGVSGACVLPHGSIGVILEVRELLGQQALTHEISPPRPALAARRAPRALVVDDSLSARRTLAQLLTDCGYEVATATDGLDAIARIDECRPDVVLADLEMPRMNGLELASHLRGRPGMKSLPIVMITSRAGEKHRSQALRAGVTEYLTKPYLEHELLDRLTELICA